MACQVLRESKRKNRSEDRRYNVWLPQSEMHVRDGLMIKPS